MAVTPDPQPTPPSGPPAAKPPPSRRADAEARRAALVIAGLFLAAGAAWLLLPDALLTSDATATAERLHLLRDALFLGVSSVLLYVVIRRAIAPSPGEDDVADRPFRAAETWPASAEDGPRLAALGRLAAGMAHDVNNMLATITGYADLALRRMRADDPNHADLLAIRRAAERGCNLTRNVLALGRAPPARPQVVELQAVLVDFGRMLPQLVGPAIRVSVETDPRPAPVLADMTQLEQVLLNLVLNARDAMPKGGRLVLRTGLLPGTALAGPRLQLEVIDTGHGMDAATRARIFEPFFTTRASGTGLGLASVALVVQAAGGSVECESTPGQGSTFRVVLPLAEQPQPSLPPVARPAAPSGDPPAVRATVLVVDDDAALCDVLARMLVEGGHEARIAHDGRQALLAATTGPADVVLCDMLMPEKEGLETITELRRHRPTLPIIAMSGALRGESYTGMALKLGAVGALRKPFGAQELLDLVAQALVTRVQPPVAPHQETEWV
jgi:signal transduction histidine kinase/ActR/RegA family two-component response regulator